MPLHSTLKPAQPVLNPVDKKSYPCASVATYAATNTDGTEGLISGAYFKFANPGSFLFLFERDKWEGNSGICIDPPDFPWPPRMFAYQELPMGPGITVGAIYSTTGAQESNFACALYNPVT